MPIMCVRCDGTRPIHMLKTDSRPFEIEIQCSALSTNFATMIKLKREKKTNGSQPSYEHGIYIVCATFISHFLTLFLAACLLSVMSTTFHIMNR